MATFKSRYRCPRSKWARLAVVRSSKDNQRCWTFWECVARTRPTQATTLVNWRALWAPQCWLVNSVCALPWPRVTWCELTWRTTVVPHQHGPQRQFPLQLGQLGLACRTRSSHWSEKVISFLLLLLLLLFPPMTIAAEQALSIPPLPGCIGQGVLATQGVQFIVHDDVLYLVILFSV